MAGTPGGSRHSLQGTATSVANPDLSKGVIVVFSGGPDDKWNPKEVRARMNQFIADVNADAYVQKYTNGKGLRFSLLPNQKERYLHQTTWRKVCDKLKTLEATPLIVVGHSNGGAAAMSLSRCLDRRFDLLFSADSVFTLDDLGDPNEVPSNVALNINSYVIPAKEFWKCPFPIGRRNRREAGEAFDRVVNVGLEYHLGGCDAHKNAFYELAGGKETTAGYSRPHLLLDTTLAVLKGEPLDDILKATLLSLQTLSTKSRLKIEFETKGLKKTVLPQRRR
jgi:hypothetical protein